MDGLLVVDKPPGPTSHDVVARARRLLGERRIGHTGTLDPMASGVLPLVVGRATRLARFLTAGDKSYEATIRLGQETDSYDAEGEPVGPLFDGPWPTRQRVEETLSRFVGTFAQQPPAFSAKKVAGQRSYALARQARARTAVDSGDTQVAAPPRLPSPATVTAHAIELLESAGPELRVRLRCSAGFYVRSLAHDIGAALGTGAHLTALRRTAAGEATLAMSVTLQALEAGGRATAIEALVPLEALLPLQPAVVLTDDAVKRVVSGRDVGPGDSRAGFDRAVAVVAEGPVRLLDAGGRLVAVAGPAARPGFLHPAVVLM